MDFEFSDFEQLLLLEEDEVSRVSTYEERARAKVALAQILDRLAAKPREDSSGVKWARRIMARYGAGEAMCQAQLDMARAAIGRYESGMPEAKLEAAKERLAIQMEDLPLNAGEGEIW